MKAEIFSPQIDHARVINEANNLEIHPVDANDLVTIGRAVIIDVRMDIEREIKSEVPGAIALPLGCLQKFAGHEPHAEDEECSAKELSAHERARLTAMLIQHAKLNTILLCICARGNRSKISAQLLRDLGYHASHSVIGGLDEWENQGLPVLQN